MCKYERINTINVRHFVPKYFDALTPRPPSPSPVSTPVIYLIGRSQNSSTSSPYPKLGSKSLKRAAFMRDGVEQFPDDP
ncbi:hypothetical protein EVAR_24753_1 [Eumeta japonica]|uniref:Uncharacterized protein n=1 Tax=Eumeta variegata TaxID=151549 RepID=A0A4C1VDY9_EUMVA|nr:hypothetical protein EVAR_24753_1 [Eumeta japonica]